MIRIIRKQDRVKRTKTSTLFKDYQSIYQYPKKKLKLNMYLVNKMDQSKLYKTTGSMLNKACVIDNYLCLKGDFRSK